MSFGSFRFGEFRLDIHDRRLERGGAPARLSGRYFDALALLVRENGKLVTKERFLDEVWRGMPVTDEALTQCIRTLRKQLGDDASRPRFIETAPKQGYRFIAPVERCDESSGELAAAPGAPSSTLTDQWRRFLFLGGAGAVGGGLAGFVGGLIYGFVGASDEMQSGIGAASMLLVLGCLTLVIGLIGGAGVAFGIAAGSFGRTRLSPWSILGGAAGGLLVGAVTKLLTTDAFSLLLGQSPGDVTGAPEGAVLGAAVGLGAWLALQDAALSISRGKIYAALCGAAAGGMITVAGGRLLGGSLDLVSKRFTSSRLPLEAIGGLLGERGFGRVSQGVTGALEGMLFAAGVVGAMLMARRFLDKGTTARLAGAGSR